MGRINVKIIDPTGNKEGNAEMPDDVPAIRIVRKLAQMLNMPEHGTDGQPLSYKLQHKSSGRQISDEQTLAAAGVQAGDVLRVLPEITAG